MNSTIDKHISRLLFDHECVTVPNFGAFIIREYSAQINSATHMLRPASKRVSFNPSIKENDGLLAKFISKEESVSYNQAIDSIAISVRSWSRMLKGGKKINLPGIGRLYLDNESKLQFNPAIEINYDKYSYGLNIFRAPSIQREMEIEQSIHEAIEKHIPSKTVEEKKRRKTPLLFRAAAVTAFLGLTITAGVYFSDEDNRQKAMASFSPFSLMSNGNSPSHKSVPVISEGSELKSDNSSSPDKDYVTSSSEEIKGDLNSTLIEPGSSEISKDENPARPEIKPEPKSDEIAKAPIKTISVEINNAYHIVVGSFKDPVNANKYIHELATKGYQAYIAKGQNNFSRVAIGNYTNSEEARKNLASIKNELNPGAWVYRN